MNIRRLLLTSAACILSVFSFAQTTLWSSVDKASVRAYTDTKKDLLPQNFRLFKLNTSRAGQLQRQALRSGMAQLPINTSGLFDLPLPNGNSLSTNLVDAPVLSAELQNAYPGIKTYQLINTANKNVAARLTISDLGVSGLVFTDNGTAYMSPLGPEYPDVHMIYYIKDLPATDVVTCGVKAELSNLREMAPMAGDGQKRTYRLAIAATGEYVTWAGSQANAVTHITIAINDVTAIYERDATISFTLVTNNNVLYTDAVTDPYASTFPNNTTLTNNQTALNTNIGIGNYDLGMVFSNGWNGGLAGLSVVCNSASKGRGSAGLDFGTGANPTAGPQGPVFVGTVAHEIAHQFSATHSFAADNGSCLGNPNAPTAYEPGGGSTIMAYASSCTGNFYQNRSDLYFHSGNIAQIQTYVTGGGNCATPVVIANNRPVVTVPAASYTIPASTPFTLSSTGTDADGNTLKYTWEQMDAGLITSSPPQATNTSGPNFRPYPPSANAASRTFPPLADILANNSPTYEVLPSVSRTMNFRVTVRDEAAGGGGTGEANTAVVVNGASGPFIVTSQNTATTWTANGTNTATITWNVANTTAAPVSCSAVDILFSIDEGLTYPYTLVANTPNDGTQTITIPNIPTYLGRIKIQSRNNIFFNVNAATVTISSTCAAEAASFAPSSSVTAPAGSPTLDLTLSPQYGTVVAPSAAIVSGDPITGLAVNNLTAGNCVYFINNQFQYKTYTFTVNVPGSYTISRTSVPPKLIINLYNNEFVPASPCTNFITSNGLYDGTFVNIGSSLTATLTPGKFYTLAIGTFNSGDPATPANFTISATGPAGGNLYTGTASPGAGFTYTYVIVDNATGLIKAIDASSNLSSSGTYPTGTYTVYGLSYSNSISPATLNGYVGGAFNALYNDILFNASTLCSNLSKNSLLATVNAALPVKLLPLLASKDGDKALLSWATASEQNNNYFEIQRSADGASFSTILGTVKGAGNSSGTINYHFTDAKPGANWNYYRVKQVDLDGTSSFTNIARVNFSDKLAAVLIYPNPAKSVLNVEYYQQNAGAVTCIVLDGKGAAVKQVIFTAQPGRNLQQLNLTGLAAGAYVLKTVSDNEVLTLKFIKE